MTRETIVPSIPDVTEDNLSEVVRAIKTLLQVREGQIGDPLDQSVTMRDLMAIGVAESTGSTVNNGGGVIPIIGVLPPPVDGYNPETDYTVPPQPTGLTGTATFKNVYLQWNGAPYRNHNYTEIWRSTSDSLGSAVRIGTTVTNLYADPVQSAQDYYYWIRFVSVANVEGPYNSSNGLLVSVPQDVAFLLAALTGQITESQLYNTLGARINLIDGPDTTSGTVNARLKEAQTQTNQSIASLQSQVNELVNAPAYSNTTAYTEGDLVTYNGGLYKAKSNTTGNLPTNTTYWTYIGAYTSLGDAVAAHTTQINTLQGGLTTEVTDRSLLAAQLRGNYTGNDITQVTAGLFYEERTARVSADSAEATARQLLSSQVNNAETGLPATRAKLLNDYSTTASMNSAIASATQSLVTQTALTTTLGSYATTSTLTNNYYTKSATDSAISSAIVGLVSQTALNSTLGSYVSNATLTNGYYTKTATDSAISAATTNLVSNTSLTTTLGSYATNSTLTNNYYTKTATDSAISSATSTLVSTTSLNNTLGSYVTSATLTTNYYTKTATDTAIAGQTSTINSRLNNFNGSGVSLETSYSTQASTVSGLSGQYTVKIDNSGFVSGFGLASTTVNSTPFSEFAIRADRFYVASPSQIQDYAGYVDSYADLLAAWPLSGKDKVSYGYSHWISNGQYEGRTLPVRNAKVVPFIVQTTATVINGKTVPPGVFMDTAFIRDATITAAKISSVTADQVTSGSVSAALGMNTGKIWGGVAVSTNKDDGTFGNLLQPFGSNLFGTGFFLGADSSVYKFYIGSPTQNLKWDGTNLYVTGTISALAGTFRNITIYDNSNNVILSSAGINSQLLGLGSLAYQSSVTTGQVSGLGTLATQNGVTTSQVSGLGTLATQNSVSTSQVSGLGTLATQDSVSAGQVSGLGTLATANEVYIGSNVRIWNGSQYIVLNAADFVSRLSKISSGNISTFIEGAAIGSAYIGTLTAANLNVTAISDTINGGATSGGRVTIQSNRILVYDENNALRVKIGNLS